MDNINVSTFGYGYDHDPELLADISKYRSGSFHYIEELDKIVNSFILELTHLLLANFVDIKLYLKAKDENKFKIS